MPQRYIKKVILYARIIRKVKSVTIFVGKKRVLSNKDFQYLLSNIPFD